jgi:ankyrin repeat protein
VGGYLEVVDKLLNAGAEVNALVGVGRETVLQAAAERGRLKVVNRLLDAGADVNAPSRYSKSTVIRLAAKAGNHVVVSRLLHAGAVIGDEHFEGDNKLLNIDAIILL